MKQNTDDEEMQHMKKYSIIIVALEIIFKKVEIYYIQGHTVLCPGNIFSMTEHTSLAISPTESVVFELFEVIIPQLQIFNHMLAVETSCDLLANRCLFTHPAIT